jgi:glycosyltransferase involved in cell wall biosynthesis
VPQLPPLSPIADQPLTVILLARNAAHHLQEVVAGWSAYLDQRPGEHELLLVDDGSSDGTGDMAGQLPRVQVLRHPKPLGEGAALRTAFAVARNPLVCYTLCDPRYRPGELDRILVQEWPSPEGGKPRPLIDLVHMAVCCHAGVPAPLLWRVAGNIRWLLQRVLFGDNSKSNASWKGWRGVGSWLTTRLLFGIRNADPECPYRLLRREVLEPLVLQSTGTFVHSEILAKANFRALLISEDVPLGDRAQPIRPPQRDGETWWQDCGRVFWHPDFGVEESKK